MSSGFIKDYQIYIFHWPNLKNDISILFDSKQKYYFPSKNCRNDFQFVWNEQELLKKPIKIDIIYLISFHIIRMLRTYEECWNFNKFQDHEKRLSI